MREVLDRLDGVRAVLFDVDGTLYRQSPVRRAMMARLARAHVGRPVTGYRVLRAIGAYRRAQEELRAAHFVGDVTAEQLRMAATRAGVDAATVRAQVERWMEIEPLRAVAANRRRGVVELLDELAARDIAVGAVSDYPAQRKLEALGIADRFAVVLSAQDAQVHAFKPDPTGLRAALAVLGVDPAAALYVGDRADVDAPAAAAAGMACVLVGGAGRRADVPRPTTVPKTMEAT